MLIDVETLFKQISGHVVSLGRFQNRTHVMGEGLRWILWRTGRRWLQFVSVSVVCGPEFGFSEVLAAELGSISFVCRPCWLHQFLLAVATGSCFVPVATAMVRSTNVKRWS